MTGTIADTHRIAVWSTSGPDAVAVHRLVQQLCSQGYDATELTSRRHPISQDVDLIVSVGDPALAVDHAIAARRPLLATQTAALAAEALAATQEFALEHHLVVRTRADDGRYRIVLATARIKPLGPLGTLTVETAGISTSGLSIDLVTADPFDLLAGGPLRPSLPVLRIEEATHHWGPPMDVDPRTTIIVRSARPGSHLRIVSDAGRHAGLASSLEIGPAVDLVLVRR